MLVPAYVGGRAGGAPCLAGEDFEMVPARVIGWKGEARPPAHAYQMVSALGRDHSKAALRRRTDEQQGRGGPP